MEQEVLIFGDQFIIKNAFHKNKKPIGVDKVEIKRIALPNEESYCKKCSFNILLNIYIKR